MIAVGMLGAWAGYAVATWGYILVRGWDIPLQQWISPLAPYTWPKPPAVPPFIPSDQLTPSSTSAAAGTPDTSGVGTPPGKIPGAYHGHTPSLGRKK